MMEGLKIIAMLAVCGIATGAAFGGAFLTVLCFIKVASVITGVPLP